MSKKCRFRGCFDRNMVNVPKHCRNLHHTTFIIFIGHWRGNCVRKGLSYWHAKSCDCLLTHWLPMKSVLILIETIRRYQFRCNYFLLHFLNLAQILNVLNENMALIAFVFPKLRTPKTWLDNCLKSPVSEDPSTTKMVNVPKHCSNLHHVTFIRFIDYYQVNWVGKSLCYWHAKSCDC